ncbi:hypothetical protein M0805_002328 [Coniferiporia weirii]|nr:hypothetical protein M0805_002328 [Coniferiporia weirii]
MSTSTQQDAAAWADFENLRHSVKSHTVDKLKQIIAGLIEECRAQLSKSGKKQELIDRITGELDRYRYMRQAEQWTRARSVLHQVRTSGVYTSSGSGQTFAANHDFAHNNVHGPAYVHAKAPLNGHHTNSGVGGSSIARYDPYAPPRRAIPAPSTPSPAKTSVSIRFKPSPFYRVDQAVSSVVECPESTGSMDRRSQLLQFTLTQEHVNKLTQSGSRFQLRLYCTTNTFYTQSPVGFRSNPLPCPIEFPATCEVRVNNTLLQANLKGIKKKPGTAPPADLSKTARMAAGAQNRVDMVYVNSQANTGPKKFYMVVFLVENSTVEQLVDRLRKGKFRTLEEVKAQMVKSIADDDEIIIGKQKMTLKCPLSYTRIKVPCRSDKCVHPQCFDAYSWYSVMEQTTTWLCPVCEKVLNPEELIVDGYFGNILDQLPESVEEVEVEPDGEWHTSDSKYGSPAWIDAHRTKVPTKAPSASDASTSNNNGKAALSSSPGTASYASASASRSLGEVVVLDSDSDDEGRVKKELSPTNSTSLSLSASKTETSFSSAPSSRAVSSAVIDLTLDSDDEGPPPTLRVTTTKRKASETPDRADDVAYKKARATGAPTPTASRKETGNGYTSVNTLMPVGPEAFSRVLPPLQRQTSVSAMSNHHHHHHRSPSAASSPPSAYYATRPAPASGQGSRPFIPYNGYNQGPGANGSGAGYSGSASESPARHLPPRPAQAQGTYNPYLPRSNASGGSAWP